MLNPDITPDSPDYAHDCATVADSLTAEHGGSTVFAFVYEGERIELVLCLLDRMDCVSAPLGVTEAGDWALVAVRGGGDEFFPLTGWVDYRRVATVLHVGQKMAVGITDLMVRVGAEIKRKEIDGRG